MNRFLLILALAASIPAIEACGHKTDVQSFDTATLAVDPKANFVMGVQTLENPDKKTGVVDYEAAYRYFRDSAQLGGGAKAHFDAAWVAEVLGRPDDAITHYGKAWEADPSYKAALFSYARVLTANGRAADAVAAFKAAAEASPKDEDLRIELLLAMGDAGMYAEALTEARDLLLANPDDPAVYRSLSTIYDQKGDYGMARLCSEKALSLDSNDAGTFNNLGVVYLAQHDVPAAIDDFKKALELDPNAYEPNMNLGFIALDSGDYALAESTLDKAVKGDPESVEARIGLAVARRGMKDYAGAGALYDAVIKDEPCLEIAYFNAATLQEKYTKDFSAALRYLETYQTTCASEIKNPTEVTARVEAVKASKAEEERRKAEEAEKVRLEEERKKRNEELLSGLGTKLTELEGKVGANGSCLGESVVEEVSMFIETARESVITPGDASMAPDIQSMLDTYYGPMVDEAVTACGGGTPAPDGGTPAPDGGTPQ